MADIESICARLCLLTRAAWKDELPAPLPRSTVCRMVRLGAISGLTLRRIPEIKRQHYERAEALLSRAAQVYALVQRYSDQGYAIILPDDAEWPENLFRLGTQMPQFLFVKGDRSLFMKNSIALAGSREVEAGTAAIARRCGDQLAKAGYGMVCGGAQGVDSAAQRAFLAAGGSLILVPAVPVSKLLEQEYLAQALDGGRLLLVCDTWPDEHFSAGKALRRNHTIYALGDAALVIASQKEKGGSWHGAVDCLRGGYTPVFAVNEDGEDFAGNRELHKLGALPVDMQLALGDQLILRQEGNACRR